VNYLAHFLLTQLLLAALKRSVQGRIINLSSSVYTAGKFDETNLQGEKGYSVFRAYSASRLLVLLSSLELANRLNGSTITANAVHPGIVRTQMMLRAPGAFRILSWLALPFARSPMRGAVTSVYLAASPGARSLSGRYFAAGKPQNIKTPFNTVPVRRRLWELSIGGLKERGLLDG
jgi:retinol dehydrogenase 12